VLVDETVTIPEQLADLARVGVVMEAVAGLEQTEWFGRGPVENYPDRWHGSPVSRWALRVRPKTTCRTAGHRRTAAEVAFGGWRSPTVGDVGSAWLPTGPARYRRATTGQSISLRPRHDVELIPRPETIVHLDVAHRGLGTASCGPDTLPQYLVGPGTYAWSWSIAPLGAIRNRDLPMANVARPTLGGSRQWAPDDRAHDDTEHGHHSHEHKEQRQDQSSSRTDCCRTAEFAASGGS